LISWGSKQIDAVYEAPRNINLNLMGDKAYQGFTELEVWKKARALKIDIKTLADGFPAIEKYRLSDQLIRAVRSVGATIAEGHGRFTYKDQLHYCIMARGSLSETYHHLIDAFDCGYITEEELKNFKSKIEETERILNGYISFLRKNSST
jgi:four helix bundle protein